MNTIKFQLLHPDAKLPTRASEHAAAYDVVATSMKFATGYVEYGLGFATEMPEGWAGYLYPRSSICDVDLALCNSVGLIDADYRGEWKVRFRLTKAHYAELYKVGDRVGQVQFRPLPLYGLETVETLTATERGTGGFGSTGQ